MNSNSNYPYCGVAAFPSGYFGHGNCQTAPGLAFNVAWTYTGQTQTLDFPIFTGNGGLSTGRQAPPNGLQTAAAAPSYTAAIYTSTIVTDGSTLVISGATVVTAGPLVSLSATSGSTGNSVSSGSSTPVGAIVGGTIGGLAFIGILALAIVFLMMRSKKSRRNESQSQMTAPAPVYSVGPGYQQAFLPPQTDFQSHASPPPQKDFQYPPAQQPQQGSYVYPQAAELEQPIEAVSELPAELDGQKPT
jgi:hypothetical protein